MELPLVQRLQCLDERALVTLQGSLACVLSTQDEVRRRTLMDKVFRRYQEATVFKAFSR